MRICRAGQVCSSMLVLGMIAICTSSLTGCHRARDGKLAKLAYTNRVLDQFDSLCSVYKEGTLGEARKSQEDAARLIENSSLEPRVKAHALYFTYSRLYVLESTARNRTTADLDFLKAKYWSARENELNGSSADLVAAHAELFSPEICFHIAHVFGSHKDRYKDPAFMARTRATTLPALNGHGDDDLEIDKAVYVTSMQQLRVRDGELVKIRGILRESRRGKYISAFVNINLVPPPNPSIAEVGSELCVVGILSSQQVGPYDARRRDAAIATDAGPVARTEYYITDYKIIPLNEKR